MSHAAIELGLMNTESAGLGIVVVAEITDRLGCRVFEDYPLSFSMGIGGPSGEMESTVIFVFFYPNDIPPGVSVLQFPNEMMVAIHRSP